MGDRIPVDDGTRSELKSIMEDDELGRWLDSKRPSRSSKVLDFLTSGEILRLILTSALIPIISFAAIWLYDHTPNRRAEADAAQADSDARAALQEIVGLAPLIVDGGKSRLLARDVLNIRAEHDKPNSARRRMLLVIGNLESADQSSKERPSAASLATQTAEPTQVTPDEKAAASTPVAAPRIAYIEIYDEIQRPTAAKLGTALKSVGVAVPGIENVMRTQPALAEQYPQRDFVGVRFFDAGTKTAAVYTANVIQQTTGLDAKAQDITGQGYEAQPGLVEVWFPKAR